MYSNIFIPKKQILYVTKISIPYESRKMLEQYLKKILEVARRGDAREESFYSALETMLMEFAISKNRQDVYVTSQPKKTDAGNPDFRVWDGKQRIVGYIEAKTPDKNLDDIEKTEQVKRYKTTFPNFVLTNFFELRLFRDGLIVDKVRIADPMTIYSLKGTPFIENEEQFENFLEKFFSFSFPSITSAQPLAVELAKRTRFLRDEVIAEELREEERNGLGKILGFYEAFQKYLIRGLTKEQFADLYSQTITYGLFASRMRCEGEFNRKLAVYDIPRSIGILREMFDFVSLGELPPQLEWIVDEISNVLANVDVKKIFSEFYRNKKGEDPVFHFYETFLAEYDPEERERRGVYYTPKPVVSYIVRSLRAILKKKFSLDDGLANEGVTVLDPAAGTLTFITEAIEKSVAEFVSRYGEGGKEGFIREHIMKDFFAFELMIAPYTIGHLKASFLLDELGLKLKDEKMKFYLTNTLELEDIEQTSLPGMASLAEESRKAGEVKKRVPILVVLGNPPYSGISANMGKWITGLIADYRYVDGKPLGERNPKWLQDDYVKFIRFAEWKISQVEKGVIGYITNHSYLDNPTFRGMRQHLMKSFDEIYVLDLHGNSLKREKCPDGSSDENVFDIRQGVSITFFVKKQKDSSKDCKVFHSERWGLREEKYEWLLSHDMDTTDWKEIYPHTEFYLFVPRDESLLDVYRNYSKVTEVFPINGVGMTTARDKFITDLDKKSLINRILLFKKSKYDDEKLHIRFRINKKKGWSIRKAWDELQTIQDKDLEKYVLPVLYRPFDVRWIFYHDALVWRTVKRIMSHMIKNNLAMCVGRAGQVVGLERPWNVVYCSGFIMDFNLFYRGGSADLPLYLYHNQDRKPNINKIFFKHLESSYNKACSAERILYYTYSILYSDIYRNKYAEFLKTDFPRVPFTADYELFNKLAQLGKKLVDLHLMRSELLAQPIAKFQGTGDNKIGRPVYDEKKGRVYINETQYFEGVEREIWEYQIGGYPILYKWLKDRKGTKLSLGDIKHYCRVVTALEHTTKIQDEIDKLYPDVEKGIIEFKEIKQNASLDEY